eukprot:1374505-Prymnesium_polylepis.1
MRSISSAVTGVAPTAVAASVHPYFWFKCSYTTRMQSRGHTGYGCHARPCVRLSGAVGLVQV